MKYLLIVILYLFIDTRTHAQDLHIKRSLVKVKVDGILDESCWNQAEKAKDFWQVFPFDSSKATTKTEAMVSFDKDYFYVAAVCYDSLPGDYVIQSLKRDFSYPISDAFTIIVDPFQDKTNGFAFGVNPMGAQREGLISNGGNFGVTTDWDNVWFSEVKRYQDKWVVEMAIPFKSLRYKNNLPFWGINFGRNDLKRNESTTWAPVPRIFNIATLTFTGKLIWDESPPISSKNITLIPYGITGTSKDFIKKTPYSNTYNMGLDAKIAVTSSLNLDLTINPDFSQVEVDRQQINLTRFNLFYPEKRLFFLENSDLFSQFGFRQIRPFFSRKIGLYQDPNSLQLYNIPIKFGARLSGKINSNWRLGIMDVQTGSDDVLNSNGQNYFVAAVQRQFAGKKGQSKSHNLSFIFVNRQKTGKINAAELSYNRIVGIDLNILTPDNRWVGKIFTHQSFSPGTKVDWNSHANASFLTYNTNQFYFAWNHEYVGKNYIADIGFVPRTILYDAKNKKNIYMSYGRLEPEIGWRYFPKNKLKKTINSVQFELYNDTYFDSSLIRLTDLQLTPNMIVKFQNSAMYTIEFINQYTKLLFPSSISGSILPAGEYYYRYINMHFESNRRTKFTYGVGMLFGEFYNGKRQSLYLDVAYRIQPYGIISLNASQDQVKFSNSINPLMIYLIGPKAEMAFTKKIFFTTFLQYNTQTKNMNVNTRFQWRFRPMCDLFFVYSDNYNETLMVKNRTIVLKFIYWLNI